MSDPYRTPGVVGLPPLRAAATRKSVWTSPTGAIELSWVHGGNTLKIHIGDATASLSEEDTCELMSILEDARAEL